MSVRVRFAPAPTGDLHLGGAMVAVANHLLRLQRGGALVLRIDDTNPEETASGAEQRIVDDLAWLGIAIDEGPVYQSDRVAEHHALAERLLAAGAAERQVDGAIVLPAIEVDVVVDDLSRGPIRMPAGVIGRTVLMRADGRPTFHLATAADDADLRISHVIRGEDHLLNTAVQQVLCSAVGIAPPAFAHLPIVVGVDGAKLSSSDADAAADIATLRASGYLSEAVVDWLARSACPPVTALPAASASELAAAFDPTRLGHGTTRLDPVLLASLGRDHLARVPADELAERVLEWVGADADEALVRALAPGLGDATTLDEAAVLVRGVAARPVLHAPTEADRTAAQALLAHASDDPSTLGVGKRAIRRVLTGSDHGIPLPYVLAALPRDEIVVRAQAVVDTP